MIAGVILAGGLSRRMGGGDKGLLPLGGRPVLAHVIERLGPQVARLALNANGDPGRFAAFGVPVIADSVEGFAGPLAGILAAMDWAAGEGAEYVATAAGDTPFLPPDMVVLLRAAIEAAQTPLALAATPGAGGGIERHPTMGLFSVDLREDLRAGLAGGVRKVVDWTDRQGCARAVLHGRSPEPFFNINTPEDLARAEGMLRA